MVRRYTFPVFALLVSGMAQALAQPAPVAGSPEQSSTPRQQGNVSPPAAITRQELVGFAAIIARAGPELARVWPGYWPEDQAFVLQVPEFGALLFSPHTSRPEGFHLVPDSELPPELAGRMFFHSGSVASTRQPFILNYPIGDSRTAVFINMQKDWETSANLLIHEQFHAFQRDVFQPNGTGRQFVAPSAITDRVSFAAAADTERRILREALVARSVSERERLLRLYFGLRREREAEMPEEVIRVERGFERSEGTAKYVDRFIRNRIFRFDETNLPILIAREFEDELVSDSGSFVMAWFRSRGYETGSTLSYFLSLYDPEGWQSRIEKGEHLDAMLQNLLNIREQDLPALAASAKEEFDLERRRSEIEPVIRAGERNEIKSVDEFLALAPFKVVLELTVPIVNGGQVGVRTGLSAMNMTPLAPDVMALPHAFQYNFTYGQVSLEVRDKPVLLGAEGKGPDHYRSVTLLSAAPQVNGVDLLPGEHRLESLTIDSDGYRLTIGAPVMLGVSENEIVIRLARQDSP